MAAVPVAILHHLLAAHRRPVPRARRRPLPRQRYPHLVEQGYAQAISSYALAPIARTLQPLIDELPSLLDSARQSRGDSTDQRRFAGLRVTVENPAGSVRSWTDRTGRSGEITMKYDYGFIDGVVAADGEDVDVYLGPDPGAEWAYVIHQMSPPDFEDYDEDKVMLGFSSANAARQAYLDQYDNPRFLGAITEAPIDAFRRLMASLGGEPYDGPLVFRADADEGRRARDLVQQARERLSDHVSPKGMQDLARRHAQQVSNSSKVQLQAQSKAALGIELETADKKLPAMVDHFAHENVSLISTLQNHTYDKIESMVTRAIASGTPHPALAKQIQERFGISESHARLIARDQVGKLYGQINAARQRELGVKRFIWRTVGDDRVRDEHDDLEHQSESEPFSYDDLPDEGLPGEPIQCRCVAEPVFEAAPDESSDDSSGDDSEEGDEED